MTRKSLAQGWVLLMHPTGNDNVRQALQALDEAGALAGFHTTLAWRAGSPWGWLLPGKLRAELERRSYPAIPQELLHGHPWRELARLVADRQGWQTLTRHQTGAFRMDAVCAALDRAVAKHLERGREHPAAVYAYEDCALESLRAARQAGAASLYELPIGYARRWQALRAAELERDPRWGQTIDGRAFSEARLARKDEELAAADRVLVPSKFVADSLLGSPAREVVVVPYGCPPVAPETVREPRGVGPLRVLFVGFLSQRKGIGYLLRAMEQLKGAAELTLVGHFSHPSAELKEELARHRWIRTLPHEEVLAEMRRAAVLVLPTLYEGRALVVLEALSQGLPVITTTNAGTEDVVVDGVSGFIVPIASSAAIVAALSRLAEEPGLVEALSEGARRMAAGCSWQHYRERLLEAVRETMASADSSN
jgi:glycosyltransferase involved in cell wall biosynthesis